ncbi:MAG: L-gulonolactone oxidase-like protein [Linnemannia gamsii]|nr:MAG: L-gulonolactone oxidase-like protein [Linnemannia gamsii]
MDHQEDTVPMDGSFIVVPKDTSSTITSSTLSQEQQPAQITTSAATSVATTTTTTTTKTTKALTSSHDSNENVSLLQKELKALSTPNKVFQNWAQTFRCMPEQYYTPTTEEEVIKIIHLARISGKHVKAIGTGHSPSDLACTDGFMINTDKLNNIIKVDDDKMTITVQAGMKLHKLHDILELHDLAMSNLGSISDQSVAGIMSTATHGTGAEYPSMCASVLALTLITATGETISCSKTERADIFNAAVCSLGALGIITRMTLQCEPAFRLENKQEPAKLNDVLSNLDSIIHSAEHVRLWWYPHTDNVVVWRANRTTKEISRPAASWRTSQWFSVHLYEGLLYVCRFIPRLIPTLSRFMFWATQSKPIERVDTSVKVFNFDCLFHQYVNEWSIPWSRTAEALKALDQFIESGIVKEDIKEVASSTVATKKANNEVPLKVHFPIEIRFVKQDDVWLSPAYGVDSCYIGIIMYRPYGKAVPYKRFWAGYEKIMASFDGRPHWAKAHSVTPEGLEKSYPKMKAFSAIRQQLDPQGMFLNAYLRRHLVVPN